MFDRGHLFGEAPGVDFATAIVDGLLARLSDQPPEAMARVTLLVNTSRLRQRIIDIFAQRGAFLLPKIHLVTQVDKLLPAHLAASNQPSLRSNLTLQLELAQLVRQLLRARPDLAPRSAAFSLAASLRDLLAEMEEERVPFEALEALDIPDLADHWQQSLTFLRLTSRYLGAQARNDTAEACANATLDALFQHWDIAPPQDPILIAGSTGSRGPTARLIARVLKMPKGAVILPGLDATLPAHIWRDLSEGRRYQDHPQARNAAIIHEAGLTINDVDSWSKTASPTPERAALLSLALRPAPVTNDWRREGPKLAATLPNATQGVTLLKARSPRHEARAIALGLRAAIAQGKRAALLTTDRDLATQVIAALDHWGVTPDDAAGKLLSHAPSGRLMRLLAQNLGRETPAQTLLILLKHPLCAKGWSERGEHLRLTREFEIGCLRQGAPYPADRHIDDWLQARLSRQPSAEEEARLFAWTAWLKTVLAQLANPAPDGPISTHNARLLGAIELLVGGPSHRSQDNLAVFFEGDAGEAARLLFEDLANGSDFAGDIPAVEYALLLARLALAREVRSQIYGRPDVMFWGTMEARVQTADLVIMAGLNEGTWPEVSDNDPWLSRQMRQELGLRLPDRRMGLAAHDFQMAAAGPEIWLSRSLRNAEAETVPSRWLNRFTNLLSGLGKDGESCLNEMTARGDRWLAIADHQDRPDHTVPRAPRPAPAPPAAARPTQLSVTQIERLIRDPYAVYARHVLRLSALQPLRRNPDAPLRGTVIHDALETFIMRTRDTWPDDPKTQFIQTLDETLTREVPWPATRLLWRDRLIKLADWFIETEAQRRAEGQPLLIEGRGALMFDMPRFTLTAKADRIDILRSAGAVIYDYKTGKAPTVKVQKHFNKQLPLEALILEAGGFEGLRNTPVEALRYISFSGGGKIESVETDAALLAETRQGLLALISAYHDPKSGFSARRAVHDIKYGGDYDHLARYGEWDDTDIPQTLPVGEHS